MIQSGAETHRVEDSLYRLLESYGFTECNVWVVPTNIQATVITPDGTCLTQIRHIRRSGIDFAALDDLNTLKADTFRIFCPAGGNRQAVPPKGVDFISSRSFGRRRFRCLFQL